MEALIIPIIISCASGGGVALLAAYGMMKYREGKQEASQESDERRLEKLESEFKDFRDTEALRDQSIESRVSVLETRSADTQKHIAEGNEVLQRLTRIETILERIEKNGHK